MSDLDHALDAMDGHEGCLEALSGLTALAHAVGDARSAFGVDVVSGGREAAAKLAALRGALGDPSRSPVPSPFPVDPAGLATLGQLGLVSTSLATVCRALQVKIGDPNAPSAIRRSLQKLSGGSGRGVSWSGGRGFFSLKRRERVDVPRLPQISQKNRERLGAVAAANTALRTNLGVSLLKPHADFRVRSVMDQARGAGVLEESRPSAASASALANLTALGAFSGAVRSVKRGLGIDLMAPRAGAGGWLDGLLDGDGSLALLCSDVALASESPDVEGSLIISPDVEVAVRALGAAGLARRSLGIDLLRPDAPFRVQAMVRSLKASGICDEARAAGLGSKEAEALGQLRAQASAMSASRATCGVSMLAARAPSKVAETLGRFASSGGAEVVKMVMVPEDMMLGLGRLVMLVAVL